MGDHGTIFPVTFSSFTPSGSLLRRRKETVDCGSLTFFSGAAANFVPWLILPKNAVSVGAAGAVFGLFAISVLVKMSWDRRKVLEVLILDELVVEKAAQAPAGTSGTFIGGYSVQSINHIAILSGALFGVFLVFSGLLLSRVPSQCPENKALNLREKRDKTL